MTAKKVADENKADDKDTKELNEAKRSVPDTVLTGAAVNRPFDGPGADLAGVIAAAKASGEDFTIVVGVESDVKRVKDALGKDVDVKYKKGQPPRWRRRIESQESREKVVPEEELLAEAHRVTEKLA